MFGFFALSRNPGLLAKAGVIIDHLSGGRAVRRSIKLISALWRAEPI